MDTNDFTLLDRRLPIDQMKVIRGPSFRKPTASSDDESFVVNRILNHRMRGREHQYLVKWEGYNSDEATWEPADMFNDEGTIRRYWQEKGMIASSAAQRRYVMLRERKRRVRERNNNERSDNDTDT